MCLRLLPKDCVLCAFVKTTSPNSPAIPKVAIELGELFADAGFELSLVGGWVRDALLQRTGADLDFTTDALPEQILQTVSGWAETTWDVGAKFGTIGAVRRGEKVEITTYRADTYASDSRKPEVAFGKSLVDDLERRDFTINAMALRLPAAELVDPFGGISDLAAGIIRTPGTAESSFSDDPLRMMRAARFAAQLNFKLAESVAAALTDMAERIEIISAERVRDELTKIMLSPDPKIGLRHLVDSGIANYVLPELPKLKLEVDEHHHHKDVYEHTLKVIDQAIELEQEHTPVMEPNLVLRMAALMHDIGKPKTRKFEPGGGVSFHHHEIVGAKITRKRMSALRFSNEEIDQVSRLVELHLRFHGFSSGEWTDSAVRRYVRDAGELLVHLHKLTRADSTTRNRKKAESLRRSYDALEARIAELAEKEELAAIRPDLDGAEIMQTLGIRPSPTVGRAYKFLLELRLDEGPKSKAEAQAALLAWWNSQQ